MTINVGVADRVVRVIVGLLLAAAPFLTGWALFDSAFWLWGTVIVGLVLVTTGIVRFCPAYRLFNFTTSRGAGDD